VGGTTADVCLITNGEVQVADHLEIGGYPLSVRSIEVNSVGAGGGSIAWVDGGGFLRVGPDSAGSNPGPVAYGLGGDKVTLTDANLVLGRLDQLSLLNGGMSLNSELSYRAVEDFGEKIGMGTEEVAEGIIKIAVANMAKGIRVISVERGFDLRDFTLVAFGGGGPMYASEIARELGIPQVLIPPHPGTGSAFGLLTSDLKHVASRSCVTSTDQVDLDAFQNLATELQTNVLQTMLDEGHGAEDVLLSAVADYRYRGQSYEISVPISLPIRDASFKEAAQQFHKVYEARYGHCNHEHPLEIVNLHIAGTASIGRAGVEEIAIGTGGEQAFAGTREIVFQGVRQTARIYQREKLGADDKIYGPAIISEYDSTTILWPDDKVSVDKYGNLILALERTAREEGPQ